MPLLEKIAHDKDRRWETHKIHHKESSRTHMNFHGSTPLANFHKDIPTKCIHYLKQDYKFCSNLKTQLNCVPPYKPEYPAQEVQGIINTHS